MHYLQMFRKRKTCAPQIIPTDYYCEINFQCKIVAFRLYLLDVTMCIDYGFHCRRQREDIFERAELQDYRA